MITDLQGASALVCGASSGLGLATARALAALGADLHLTARRGELLEREADGLRRDHSVRVATSVLDLADPPALKEMLASVADDPPNIVVIGGGGPPPMTVSDLDLGELDAAYRSLLRPAATIAASLAPAMAARGGGVLVFITSSGVKEPIDGLVSSNIFRAGVTALAKCTATEFAARGVRSLCVAPGRIATERVAALDGARAERTGTAVEDVQEASIASIPAGRYGDPDEFGEMVALLCTPAAAYVTGVTISIDGGKSTGLLA
ncbi:SDR family oxidoreductase [Nitriliruptor alkaliphilus]|uniref:SDR family oxidoreductase n=1 Tax=Nitriliruptor alkaliphilus TaxID=427918 RepID=UPI000695DE56|nr:SDR family oxidoreductase [Nitriliruptor alkaliphilus]